MTQPRQLLLPVALEPGLTFATFVSRDDARALGRVRLRATGAEPAPLWCAGPDGSGKSHLLQAAVDETQGRSLRAAYLPLGLEGLEPEALDGLEAFELVALDDVDRRIGARAWEQALMRLYEAVSGGRGALLLAACRLPRRLDFVLPDLRSRLTSIETVTLPLLDDSDVEEVLMRHAAASGYELDDTITTYLLRRLPRDPRTLKRVIDRADQLALERKTRLTLPLVRQALDDDA